MSTTSDIYDVTILDNKIQLSSTVLQSLGAKPKDRIAIVYSNRAGKMTPVIKIDESGNVLTTAGSFVFKGQDREFLLQYGKNFKAIDDLGTIYLEGDQEFKVFTSVKQAVECPIDISIIEDTNYNITKFEKYEL